MPQTAFRKTIRKPLHMTALEQRTELEIKSRIRPSVVFKSTQSVEQNPPPRSGLCDFVQQPAAVVQRRLTFVQRSEYDLRYLLLRPTFPPQNLRHSSGDLHSP